MKAAAIKKAPLPWAAVLHSPTMICACHAEACGIGSQAVRYLWLVPKDYLSRYNCNSNLFLYLVAKVDSDEELTHFADGAIGQAHF